MFAFDLPQSLGVFVADNTDLPGHLGVVGMELLPAFGDVGLYRLLHDSQHLHGLGRELLVYFFLRLLEVVQLQVQVVLVGLHHRQQLFVVNAHIVPVEVRQELLELVLEVAIGVLHRNGVLRVQVLL